MLISPLLLEPVGGFVAECAQVRNHQLLDIHSEFLGGNVYHAQHDFVEHIIGTTLWKVLNNVNMRIIHSCYTCKHKHIVSQPNRYVKDKQSGMSAR